MCATTGRSETNGSTAGHPKQQRFRIEYVHSQYLAMPFDTQTYHTSSSTTHSTTNDHQPSQFSSSSAGPDDSRENATCALTAPNITLEFVLSRSTAHEYNANAHQPRRKQRFHPQYCKYRSTTPDSVRHGTHMHCSDRPYTTHAQFKQEGQRRAAAVAGRKENPHSRAQRHVHAVITTFLWPT